MPISSDTVRLAVVQMTGNPPTVPASPTFIVARMTAENVAYAPTTTASAELDPSGQVRDSIVTGGATTGDVSMEISNNEFLDAMLAAVFGNSWDVNDQLVPGTDLPQFLMEKSFPGIPTTGDTAYHRFPNTVASGMSLSVAPGAPINGGVSYSGGVLELATAPLTGATYPDPGSADVLSPTDVTIAMDAWAATSCFGSLDMTFDNAARGIECIGTLGTAAQVRGRFTALINAEVYYSNDAPLQDLLDQDSFSVQVILSDTNDLPTYTFEFPRCKMTAAPVVAAGTDTDVMASLSMQALYDSTLGYTCRVTRPDSTP